MSKMFDLPVTLYTWTPNVDNLEHNLDFYLTIRRNKKDGGMSILEMIFSNFNGLRLMRIRSCF